MALLQAGLAAGTSLIGGLFGNNNAKKAAKDQFQYQDALNNNAFMYQRVLQDQQNANVNGLNNQIAAHNRDILDNHSTAVLDRQERNETWSDSAATSDTKTTEQTNSSYQDTGQTTGHIDFQRMVADAEAAGFNPLSVLRAGGLAGYSVTNTVNSGSSQANFTGQTTTTANTRTHQIDTHNVFETYKPARDLMTFFGHGEIPYAPAAGNAPVVQYGNPVGDALKAGLNAWSSFDKNAQARAELEKGLALAQIRNLDSDTQRNLNMQVPSWTDTGQRVSAGGIGGAVQSIGNGILGAVAQPTTGDVKVTNPHNMLTVKPTQRDGSAYAERYGEPGEWFFAPYVVGQDLGHNLNEMTGGMGHRAGDSIKAGTQAASDYLKSLYGAMQNAWNSPAWNAKP